MTADSDQRPPAEPGRHEASIWLVARHDFRQPVQSLEFLASAMANARTDEARRQCAGQMADLAATLRTMTEGLTQVSRLEAGEVIPAPAQIRLADALESAIGALGARRAAVETHTLAGEANADPALLAAALEGLLLYALKFSEAGPVTVASKATRGRGVIEIGFDGRHPRSALTGQAFVELAPAADGARPSIGLGPALVVRLASVLGWRLDLDSASDHAARVRLTLGSPLSL